MPYKDLEKQREAQKIWARNNRTTTNKYRTKSRRRSKDKVFSLKKSTPCFDCKGSFPYYIMQFDHRPDEIKLGCVSVMVNQNVRWELVEQEIAKCDIVCANCHAERTFIRIGGRVDDGASLEN